MAHLMRARTAAEVLQLQPMKPWSSDAPIPRLPSASSQMAMSHFVSAGWVPSIIVPFFAPSWRELR